MKDQTFMKNYAKLKAFFDEHGHSDVKARGGGSLGHFVSATRTLYRRQSEVGRRLLSDECIADLKKINFIFIKNKCRKSEQFKKLVRGIKTFRKYYNHVNIDSTSESAMPKGCEDLKELLSWARRTKLGRDRIEDLRITLQFSLEPTGADRSHHFLTSGLGNDRNSSAEAYRYAATMPYADDFLPHNPGEDRIENSLTNVVHERSRVEGSGLNTFENRNSSAGAQLSDMDAAKMPSDNFFPHNPREDEIENSRNSLAGAYAATMPYADFFPHNVHERSRVEGSGLNTFDNRNFSAGAQLSDMDAAKMPSDNFFPHNPREDEIESSLTNVVHERSRVEESCQNTFDNRNSSAGAKLSDMDAAKMPSDNFFPHNPREDEIENSLTNVVHERSRVEESCQNTFNNRNSSQQEGANQSNGQATKKKKKDKQVRWKPQNLPLNRVDDNIRTEEIAPPRRRSSRLSQK